jgi:cell division transport system permease protein
MHKGDNRHTQRKLISSYFTSMVSISLVLFMLGLIGFLILNAKKLSDYVKENIGFTVFLKENVKEADVFQIQKILDTKPYVKETMYIKVIEENLQDFSEIKEVHYQKSLIHLVNENVKKISVFILFISIILLLIALALINNTIRLAVYSKRFLIRTMQLVGATGRFIRRPFLNRSIIQGCIGALTAMLMLSAMIYFMQMELEGIIGFKDYTILGVLYVFVLFLGIAIKWISTYFAVNKYLRIKTDNLYS